ncbi:hypothetical protein BKA61DRAFT_722351, partial [Leptodontidium sp. MPI-SDFR-AT-0119]
QGRGLPQPRPSLCSTVLPSRLPATATAATAATRCHLLPSPEMRRQSHATAGRSSVSLGFNASLQRKLFAAFHTGISSGGTVLRCTRLAAHCFERASRGLLLLAAGTSAACSSLSLPLSPLTPSACLHLSVNPLSSPPHPAPGLYLLHTALCILHKNCNVCPAGPAPLYLVLALVLVPEGNCSVPHQESR